MTRRILNVVLVLACLLGFQSANAEFKDIRIDLTNGNLLSSEETAGQSIKFGVTVGSDGSVTRVAADDTSAAMVLSGKFHSNEHGWGNFSSTVKVDGPVKISMGTCAWGGDVTVKNEAGETVATFNTNDGTCYHNTRGENGIGNVAYGFYRGEAATITISGGNYTPYIAVEKVTDMPKEAEISFGYGDYADCGVLPANDKVDLGATFTIPVNCTIYKEGKTLIGWTDGTKTYQLGEIITVTESIALTPVFVDNTVSLADRKDAVTIRWDFQRKNGAPTVAYQNKDGFWVAQAKVGTEVIDVQLNFQTNNGGKIANANWNDWAQMNGGTTFQVPSCKGATISLESYSATTTTTIDGEKIGDGTNQPSFTVAGSAETAELVIGDGSYFRWIQVMLPYVPKDLTGTTYSNENASVVWALNSNNYMEDITVSPENSFAITNFDLGVCKVTGTGSTTVCENITFINIQSANGGSDVIKWTVKPVKGLTFTPTSVSFYVARAGTDGTENCVTVSGEIEGVSETFKSITPHRNNKTQNDDKFGSSDSYTTKFEYTLTEAQQKALTSGEGFSLSMNNGYATNKSLMVSDVHINGVLNGTVAAVDKYSLTLSSNIESAGTVTAYPSADKYEVGTEVKLAATRNFGYKFINWTDAAGNEISKEATFIYTVTANAEICANFEAINTFALNYKVTGGANLYMVSLEPAPTVIDNKNMYEEGTTVTATASSNPILSFTNWNDGQTSSEISVVMDADKSVIANYSAVDYIAGWDFIRSGADGRPADFASADNDAASLVLRKADGTTSGWLDKSQNAAGGYEGRPGGVNWRDNCLGDYYWQTMVNAEAFTDIKLITAMCYNYNAYQVYNIEYSIDGENWTKVGAIEMPGVKNWTDGEFNLPAAANNQPKLYIRWIADKNSTVDGTSSEKDGICIGASYIVGTAKLIDDGTAPKLVSAVPEEGATTASINGKIVLTFDEKVKVKEGVKATLGDLEIEPEVVGKTVIFKYKNLTYGTKYTFNLPAGSISDLTDNAIAEAIKINFSTKTRPAIAKALYDAEVSTVDELVAAIKAAQTREDMTKRFRIFIHDGFYRLPASETATKDGIDGNKYPDPTTYINSPKISFIGESMEGVVITNTVPETEGNNGFNTANVLEGIGRGDVLRLDGKATETYFQNLTMKSSMGDARGRDIVLNDNSNKTIFKDACLWAYQDTYVSNNNNSRFYFEGGLLRGRTDFLCGKGDVFYNGVTLQMCASGGHLAVPSVPTKYGYIFKDCEIVGETSDVDGNFSLGRPWGSGTPIALYIDTKMTARPSAAGWTEMSGGWPARYAEYNSTTASGTVIDLSQRKTIFGDGHENNPILTKDEADAVSYEVVMGGDDDWDPASAAEQAPEPTNVKLDNGIITWDNSDYASCWAVCKDGKVIGFTLEPTFEVSDEKAAYSVRAANEMGGLGAAVKAELNSAINTIDADSQIVSTVWYNLQGMRVSPDTKGVVLRVDTLESGRTVTTKTIVK